ncbi:bacteriocin-protection, YdeI or OmpD-associated-domain-containing protein [Podospora australis]|uniref:Bacteriocin-protection, YdeI or OmpD-associated-domain-containing protein n=1 Tax=Podospora australis TaxID=1536484 RepID=A0AAN7AK76_9PEZI|nr:bacteriocin-protection, YdeI or OmpD-associated-domain-containing protein [Podospora australis]
MQTRSAAKVAKAVTKSAAATVKAKSAKSSVAVKPSNAETSTTSSKQAAVSTSVTTASSTSTLPIHHFPDAKAWETWLEIHHATETLGIWMKISKKGSGIPSVTYDEAIDCALCFGWIDGQRKSHDAQHFIQRFTPRRKKSMWSKRNVDKVAVLTAPGRMRPAGQDEVDAAKADGRWEKAYSGSSVMEVPADLEAALGKNKRAHTFWEGLSRTKRYPFLWRIETAKKAETREKRVEEFIGLLSKGKTL